MAEKQSLSEVVGRTSQSLDDTHVSCTPRSHNYVKLRQAQPVIKF